jgi:CBS domain-containing membrane protein
MAALRSPRHASDVPRLAWILHCSSLHKEISDMPGNARPVLDLMTKEVVTIDANEPLALAEGVMQLGRIRHMPVVDEEKNLVGIISQRDLFRGALSLTLGLGRHAQDKMLDSIRAKEVMQPDVKTVEPNASIEDAAEIMLEQKIGCLVVVEAQEIVGILTESDFVKLVARGR